MAGDVGFFLLLSAIYLVTAICSALVVARRPWRLRRLLSLAFRWKRQAVRLQRENVRLEIELSRWRGACYSVGAYSVDLAKDAIAAKSKLKEVEDLNAELRKKVLPDGL